MKKGILSTRQTLPIFRKLLSFLKMCDKGRYAVAPNWRPQEGGVRGGGVLEMAHFDAHLRYSDVLILKFCFAT